MSIKYEIDNNKESQMAAESAVAYGAHSAPAFSSYQMQILDSIANVHDENEMREIRDLIADYFSNKALDTMDRLCDEGKLSDAEIESWHSEHLRTPYNY